MTFALLAVSVAVPVEHHDEYHNESPAEYEFSYSVNEHSTGDIKSHQESRKGNAVTGKYELIDSDGYRRIVEYTADEHTGFNAVVHREPTDIKIPIFQSHHSYEPAHHYSQHAHLEHNIPAQQSYVAPKVVKNIVKPIVKVTPIEVSEPKVEPEHHVLQVKYVAPKVAKLAKVEHSHLNTHVSYNAPEFNYHY